MIRRPPRSTPLYSSAASDVYKRQGAVSHPPSPGEEGHQEYGGPENPELDYLSHGGPSHAPQAYVYGDGSCHQCDPHGIGHGREDLEDLGATQHLWSRVEETDNEY